VVLPRNELGTGPTIVLLHAGVADRTMWDEHLEPIAEAGFRALAFDLPGFGEAPVAERDEPWSDVLETLDELSTEQAALVGNSFGGAVALRVAILAPRRCWALALLSAPPPGLEPSAELAAAWEAEEAALDRGDTDGAVDAVVSAWTLPDAPRTLRERIAAMQRRAFILQSGVSPSVEAPDPLEEHPERLARLDVPALIAVGERDMLDFRDGAESIASMLPESRHALIPAAGHLAPLEVPEAFRALLFDFLRRLRPGASG
jgi:pimeloyl-ACP methyl ester carboxylesterase